MIHQNIITVGVKAQCASVCTVYVCECNMRHHMKGRTALLPHICTGMYIYIYIYDVDGECRQRRSSLFLRHWDEEAQVMSLNVSLSVAGYNLTRE